MLMQAHRQNEGITGEVFASNRAQARIALEVEARAGVTRRRRVHEAGPLRVRCPGPPSPELEAVLVNTAGGMAGGDRFDIDITISDGAQLALTTAAAEKVYRTLGPDTTVTVNIAIGEDGALAWLPQETILFNHARLSRQIEVELSAGAHLLLAEAIVFGRSGMGEIVEDGSLFDRWRIRRAGRLIHAESVRLDGPIVRKLSQSAVADGRVAMATALMIPGDDGTVEAARALTAQFRGEVGASAWNGLAVMRFCAHDGAALRHDLMQVLAALRAGALPRLWTN